MGSVSANRLLLTNAIDATKSRFDSYKTNKIILSLKNKHSDMLAISDDKPFLVTYKSNKDKARITTTFAKYVRRQLDLKYSDVDDYFLENFSKSITSFVLKNRTNFVGLIKILRGEDILKFYSEADTKTKSCMTGPQNTEKIRMYAINPTKICLVTSENVARGLFWTADDGQKLLDYVYPYGAQSSRIIIDWAKNRGYNSIEMDGLSKIKVTVKTTPLYPRLDCVKYVALKENNTAELYSYVDSPTTHVFDSINGSMRKKRDCEY